MTVDAVLVHDAFGDLHHGAIEGEGGAGRRLICEVGEAFGHPGGLLRDQTGGAHDCDKEGEGGGNDRPGCSAADVSGSHR